MGKEKRSKKQLEQEKLHKLQKGGIVSKEFAEKIGLNRTHDQELYEAGDGLESLIHANKLAQDLYSPFGGKVKLTESMKKRLFGETEPISIGFKKKLSGESDLGHVYDQIIILRNICERIKKAIKKWGSTGESEDKDRLLS